MTKDELIIYAHRHNLTVLDTAEYHDLCASAAAGIVVASDLDRDLAALVGRRSSD